MAAAAAGLALLVAADAAAQPGPSIPDEVARKMVELALKRIDHATCDGLNNCAPATPQELEYPPITLDQTRAAMLAGTRSALARWCGLDADRRSVLPLMQHLRRVLRFNSRQVALMAVIHSIQLSVVSEQLKARGECDAATRGKLDSELPNKR